VGGSGISASVVDVGTWMKTMVLDKTNAADKWKKQQGLRADDKLLVAKKREPKLPSFILSLWLERYVIQDEGIRADAMLVDSEEANLKTKRL
jgi:hypothetical protein